MAWTAPTTRATSDLITASIWNTDLVDNISFLGVTHDHSGDSGDGGDVRRAIWVPPVHVTGTGSVHHSFVPGGAATDTIPAAEFADNQDDVAYFSFSAPAKFQALDRAVMVLVAAATGNMVRSAVSVHTADQVTVQSDTDSVAAGAIAMTANVWEADDIIAVFTALAAQDYVGLAYKRDGTNGSDTIGAIVYCVGLLIEYH